MRVVDVTYRVARQVETDRVYARTNRAEKAIDYARKVVGDGDGFVSAKIIDDAARRREWRLPEPPRYTVIVEWEDGSDGDADADEITVAASSAAGAVSKAKARWRRTHGKQWPSCRIVAAWVATPDRLERF